MMEGVKQAKFVERNRRVGSGKNGFDAKSKLNLNDLLEKRREEKKKDKKTNLLIFSGATVVVAAVLAILSL